MWRARLRHIPRLGQFLGLSLVGGIGLVGLSFAQQHVEDSNDENVQLQTAFEGQRQGGNTNFNIAIIGSGIGGTSAAHFVRQALGSNVRIDVFEKESKVGGRMALVEVDQNLFEAGASVVHESNKYVGDFCDLLGIDKLSDVDWFGIYNGKEFLYTSTGYSLYDSVMLFLRYGFSLIKMGRFTAKTLADFVNIYKIQDDGQCFETVEGLLRRLGGQNFIELNRESSREALEKRGVTAGIISELATAVSRNNYGQDLGLNAFTGFVSLAGAQSGKLWATKGGNMKICEGMLERSNVNLMLDTKVQSISRKVVEDNRVKYSLNIVRNESKDEAKEAIIGGIVYDAVIIAVPLEVGTSFISCTNCNSKESQWPILEELGHYQLTVATFVKGHLNPKAFGLTRAKDLPPMILTTENRELCFSSIVELKTVEGKLASDERGSVYNIFSRLPLTKEQLDELFVDRVETRRVDWLAYPHYTPPEKFTSFRLDDGVFYVNALERAASAMEMSAIAGRNAALLALNHLKLTRN
eukprot:gene17071-18791_t